MGSIDIAGFRWSKPDRECGFGWGTIKGDRQLRWSAEERGGYVITYPPSLGLFRNFAALRVAGSKAEKEIQKFANEYGDILAVPGTDKYELDNDLGRRTRRFHGTLRVWRHQVEQMRWAVGLWDQSNDESALKGSRLQAREDLPLEIESALRDLNTPSCTRVCLNHNLELSVYPVNLLAFMWLSFARVVAGKIQERPCTGLKLTGQPCPNFVYFEPGVRRYDERATCSPACRKRKQRPKD
jgi:hypothetical protein